MKKVTIGDLEVGNDKPFTLIAGPCAMESREHALEMASGLSEICGKLGIGLIYKSSFDKGNRTSIDSPRGIGMAKALDVFAEVRAKFGCPAITDVHEAAQCAPVAEAVDVLQIPAFLCRQTDLLVAAGKTGRCVNVKKGQFLAPWEMPHVAAKVASTGNDKILRVDPKAFHQGVDRVATIATEKTRAVKMGLDNDRVTLSVTSPDNGNASEELAASYSSEGFEIGFNANYLKDILGQFDSDEVELHLADAGAPTLIREDDASPALYVLMPMRV